MKHALILGGTSGLGLEIARLFHADGTMPIIVGRTAKSIGESLGFEHITCDFAEENAQQIVMSGLSDIASVSYFVIAGGELLPNKETKGDAAIIDRLWRVNLMVPKRLVREFTIARRSGYQLITVASTSATIPRTNETEYAAVQAARRQWSLSFHHELTELCPGSRSFVVCPGGMDSPAWGKIGVEVKNFMSTTEVAKIVYATTKDQVEGRCQELRIERNPADGTLIVLPVVTYFG